MGDGGWTENGVHFTNHSFTLDEVILLQNSLKEYYDLESNIHIYKNYQPRLYITTKSVPKMVDIVKPYFHEKFYYKIDKKYKNP
jgi:hypothetical protein